MEPLDFDAEISEAGDGRYRIEIRSPGGEVQASHAFPFDTLELENRLQSLRIALLTSGRGERGTLSTEEKSVQEFASDLFEFLFADGYSCYDRSRDKAQERGSPLRIRIRCQVAALAGLPWEFLFDPRRSSYLCLSRKTQVVRYLEIPEPIVPLPVTAPLRIIGVVASPDDLPPLAVESERQRLERAIEPLQRAGLVVLEWAEPTWRALLQALRDDVWHVFHFSGHGSFDRNRRSGKLAFVDDSTAGGGTTTRWLDAEELGALLGDTDSLRLAFLNACEGATADAQDVFSSTAGVLVRRGTPAVVAMQHPISDRAAIELARTFYESLANGLAVDSALAEARKAVLLSIPGTLEWGTPVLFMRTADGVLFHVERPTETRVRGEAPAIERADHDRGVGRPVEERPVDERPVDERPVDERPIVVPPPPHHEDRGSHEGGKGGGEKSSRRRLLALGVLVVLLAAAVAVIALTRGGSGGGNGIAVPDVAGRPLGDAEAIVQQAGFRVAGATTSDAATPFGVVIRTDPAAGTSEKKGSTVTLVVSTGPPAGSTNPNNNGNRGSTPTDTKSTVVTVTVPNVLGMTQDQAAATLQAVGLNPVTHFQSGPLTQVGKVVDQDPRPGTPADRGRTVTIDVPTGTLSTVTPARPIP